MNYNFISIIYRKTIYNRPLLKGKGILNTSALKSPHLPIK